MNKEQLIKYLEKMIKYDKERVENSGTEGRMFAEYGLEIYSDILKKVRRLKP